jgi:hypothetical protein
MNLDQPPPPYTAAAAGGGLNQEGGWSAKSAIIGLYKRAQSLDPITSHPAIEQVSRPGRQKEEKRSLQQLSLSLSGLSISI